MDEPDDNQETHDGGVPFFSSSNDDKGSGTDLSWRLLSDRRMPIRRRNADTSSRWIWANFAADVSRLLVLSRDLRPDLLRLRLAPPSPSEEKPSESEWTYSSSDPTMPSSSSCLIVAEGGGGAAAAAGDGASFFFRLDLLILAEAESILNNSSMFLLVICTCVGRSLGGAMLFVSSCEVD